MASFSPSLRPPGGPELSEPRRSKGALPLHLSNFKAHGRSKGSVPPTLSLLTGPRAQSGPSFGTGSVYKSPRGLGKAVGNGAQEGTPGGQIQPRLGRPSCAYPGASQGCRAGDAPRPPGPPSLPDNSRRGTSRGGSPHPAGAQPPTCPGGRSSWSSWCCGRCRKPCRRSPWPPPSPGVAAAARSRPS